MRRERREWMKRLWEEKRKMSRATHGPTDAIIIKEEEEGYLKQKLIKY